MYYIIIHSLCGGNLINHPSTVNNGKNKVDECKPAEKENNNDNNNNTDKDAGDCMLVGSYCLLVVNGIISNFEIIANCEMMSPYTNPGTVSTIIYAPLIYAIISNFERMK